jgi:hypothetical protein
MALLTDGKLTGERDGVVQHGSQRVHKRHAQDGGGEQVWAHVADRAHGEPARGAALDAEPPRRGEPALHQQLRAGHEVGEGVALQQELAVLVPPPAHLAAAAHVRDGKHEAAVQQREPGAAEVGVVGDFVGAVGVEQQRV